MMTPDEKREQEQLDRRLRELERKVGGGATGERTLSRVKGNQRDLVLARRVARITRARE